MSAATESYASVARVLPDGVTGEPQRREFLRVGSRILTPVNTFCVLGRPSRRCCIVVIVVHQHTRHKDPPCWEPSLDVAATSKSPHLRNFHHCHFGISHWILHNRLVLVQGHRARKDAESCWIPLLADHELPVDCERLNRGYFSNWSLLIAIHQMSMTQMSYMIEKTLRNMMPPTATLMNKTNHESTVPDSLVLTEV